MWLPVSHDQLWLLPFTFIKNKVRFITFAILEFQNIYILPTFQLEGKIKLIKINHVHIFYRVLCPSRLFHPHYDRLSPKCNDHEKSSIES
jgi:hypothetical protein